VGAAFTAWSFWLKGVPGQLIETPELEWGWEFCTPNVVLATFGVLLLFTSMRRERAPRLVVSLSKLSFGMYLMHLLWLHLFVVLFVGSGGAASPVVPVWAAIPLIAICTFICCALTTKVLSYLPGSKWVIGV
jgi:surface polysaccharide O-acyltransferase-like enzyme